MYGCVVLRNVKLDLGLLGSAETYQGIDCQSYEYTRHKVTMRNDNRRMANLRISDVPAESTNVPPPSLERKGGMVGKYAHNLSNPNPLKLILLLLFSLYLINASATHSPPSPPSLP